jgi:hypothetical protein
LDASNHRDGEHKRAIQHFPVSKNSSIWLAPQKTHNVCRGVLLRNGDLEKLGIVRVSCISQDINLALTDEKFVT